MSLNDLFEALKALIIPFITRFEKLERRLSDIEESAAYTADLAEEIQGDQLDDRLTRVESRLGEGGIVTSEDAEAVIRDLLHREGFDYRLDEIKEDQERVSEAVGDYWAEARDYHCRVESLETEVDAFKAAHQKQAETIAALLKALEWEPPKD